MIPESAGLDRQCAGNTPVPKVAAAINWFGITDVADVIDGPNKANLAVTWLGSLPNKDEIAKRVSPLTYVRPGVPPTISIHGDRTSSCPTTTRRACTRRSPRRACRISWSRSRMGATATHATERTKFCDHPRVLEEAGARRESLTRWRSTDQELRRRVRPSRQHRRAAVRRRSSATSPTPASRSSSTSACSIHATAWPTKPGASAASASATTTFQWISTRRSPTTCAASSTRWTPRRTGRCSSLCRQLPGLELVALYGEARLG